MLDRLACGQLPAKHHTALRGNSAGAAPSAEGLSGVSQAPVSGQGGEPRLHYEHCLTRSGFEGAFTISYHRGRPQAWASAGGPADPTVAPPLSSRCLRRQHWRTAGLPASQTPVALRQMLLVGPSVRIGLVVPAASDQGYMLHAQEDELLFVYSGAGCVRSPLGDLPFETGDYVLLPKGLLFRLVLDSTHKNQRFLSLCFAQGVGIPGRFRNGWGQLKLDAPYSHRDFRRPQFKGPLDEGLREAWVSTRSGLERFVLPGSPLDVVGWDGVVYPIAFPIRAFQPKVGSVHLPPTWHTTFDSPGALVCSFVPRPLDFHSDAVPCPYAHTSVDMDEVLFYVEGAFSSRLGVSGGSLTHHPSGVPHGPHPGRYEASLGAKRTEELAVMLDCREALRGTALASSLADGDYDRSFAG